MRIASLQILTWSTVAAAVACALSLAVMAPLHPASVPHQDSAVGVFAELSWPTEPTAAGRPASAPAQGKGAEAETAASPAVAPR